MAVSLVYGLQQYSGSACCQVFPRIPSKLGGWASKGSHVAAATSKAIRRLHSDGQKPVLTAVGERLTFNVIDTQSQGVLWWKNPPIKVAETVAFGVFPRQALCWHRIRGKVSNQPIGHVTLGIEAVHLRCKSKRCVGMGAPELHAGQAEEAPQLRQSLGQNPVVTSRCNPA